MLASDGEFGGSVIIAVADTVTGVPVLASTAVETASSTLEIFFVISSASAGDGARTCTWMLTARRRRLASWIDVITTRLVGTTNEVAIEDLILVCTLSVTWEAEISPPIEMRRETFEAGVHCEISEEAGSE